MFNTLTDQKYKISYQRGSFNFEMKTLLSWEKIKTHNVIFLYFCIKFAVFIFLGEKAFFLANIFSAYLLTRKK